MSRPHDPCLLIIFGASGDLTKRKLIPALYELYRGGNLPERFAVMGVSRSKMSDSDFAERALPFAKKDDGFDGDTWAEFAKSLHYHAADATAFDDFPSIEKRMGELAADHGTGENALFYLSVAPQLYEPIITNIGAAQLVTEGRRWCSIDRSERPWQRIVVEKPFGHDLESAAHLNRVLGRVFDDEGIYRIDHYLGKETVQNLMVFRFANAIFEPLWNRNYVEHVQISAIETVGVEGRGGYFEGTGAMRDMIQSHLLQVMAAVAMEPPNTHKAADMRGEQRKILEAVADIAPEDVSKQAVRGQYTAGKIGDRDYVDYLAEDDVAADSNTDTYAALKCYVDNWRWQGVPFYIRTGKATAKKLTQIVIYFKPTPHRLFSPEGDPTVKRNRLVINVQPDEGISLRFDAKIPGQEMQTTPVVLDFDYAETFDAEIPDAYASLLHDVMQGNQALFKDRHEIEAAWRIVTPVLAAWEANPRADMQTYEAGSWGPDAADKLFPSHDSWYNPEGESTRYRAGRK